jgi:hypothetical protein
MNIGSVTVSDKEVRDGAMPSCLSLLKIPPWHCIVIAHCLKRLLSNIIVTDVDSFIHCKMLV